MRDLIVGKQNLAGSSLLDVMREEWTKATPKQLRRIIRTDTAYIHVRSGETILSIVKEEFDTIRSV